MTLVVRSFFPCLVPSSRIVCPLLGYFDTFSRPKFSKCILLFFSFIFWPRYDRKNVPLLRSSTHPNAQMHSPSLPPIRNATSQPLARLARWREHATNGANCIKEGLQLQLLHTAQWVSASFFFLFTLSCPLYLSIPTLILLSHLAVTPRTAAHATLYFPPRCLALPRLFWAWLIPSPCASMT